MNHDLPTCMCDSCITIRKRQEIELREHAKKSAEYIARRGGEPGASDLRDALHERSKDVP